MRRLRGPIAVLLLVLSCSFLLLGCPSGSKGSDDTGTDPDAGEGPNTDGAEAKLYIVGYTNNSSDVEVPCYWVDGNRTDLPRLASSEDGIATDIVIVGGTIYIAGFTGSASKHVIPCYWKNGVRTDWADGLDSSENGYAYGIAVVGGSVFLAGVVRDTDPSLSGEGESPCYWKDGIRHDLPTRSTMKDAAASGIAVDGASVYICGYSADLADDKHVACYWVDGVRKDLSCDRESEAQSITVSNGAVYISGNIFGNRQPQYPCYWLLVGGASYVTLPLPDPEADYYGNTHAVAVSGMKVYVAGSYGLASLDEPVSPCYWADETRVVLPVIAAGQYGEAMDICLYDGEVYTCGTVEGSSAEKTPCYWKGSERTELSTLGSSHLGVAEACIYQ